ncbi:ATP-binding protein [Streptomyces sp. G-G2]|uniref:ATP-binding protein n=1 Tax=Streptomyces sp. G-G2 TaxID=3046201 RepID=UPI0024B9DD89|nr:ATP-binding protein [Streptomyces sp. G-G2]MDJ0385943.1 ATP-binding protein [Streptomyces sp. G-G2]
MGTMGTDLAAGPSAVSPAYARERARGFLDALARPLAREAEQSVVLVVSELVTNALRHSGGTYTLELTAHPDGVEVAVHDPSPQAPVMHTPDLTGTGGFGWRMVNRLALATHVTAAPGGGKTVRALLPR